MVKFGYVVFAEKGVAQKVMKEGYTIFQGHKIAVKDMLNRNWMFSFNDVLAFSFLKGFGHNSIKQKFKFLKLIPFGIFVHFDKASRFFWNKYCVHGPICFYRKLQLN